jgi:excisionase family DNA binding protein
MLTVQEAADQANVQAGSIRRAIADGSLPARKLGRRWLIDPEQLTKWLRDWDTPTGYVKVPGVAGFLKLSDLPPDLRAEYEASL